MVIIMNIMKQAAVFLLVAFISRVASADTYTVTSASDAYVGDMQHPVTGTLRWAIIQANYHPGPDAINFNIPRSGISTITLPPHDPRQDGTPMDGNLYVKDSVVVDATTQPGYNGRPLIEINANGQNQGFFLTAGNQITIRGFVINRFSSNGITIWPDSSNNSILDNWIGLDQNGTGTPAVGSNPGLRGIGIQSSRNYIKGNVISNVSNGITVGFAIESSRVNSFRCVRNVISENKIGTDPTGTAAVGNNSDGIFLGAGAAFTWIGPRNVLSGNASSGVEMLHWTNQYNVVFDNLIGVNLTGTAAVANGELGVLVSNGASHNAIGGPSGGNVIAGNKLGGVAIGGDLAYVSGIGNWIENNYIGTDAAGKIAIPNGDGVIIGTSESYWNTVKNNLIAGNRGAGIVTNGALSNWIESNWIGVTFSGARLGNGRAGISFIGSSYNTIVSNNIQYNGFSDPAYGGWRGINEFNECVSNGYWNNYVANNLNQ